MTSGGDFPFPTLRSAKSACYGRKIHPGFTFPHRSAGIVWVPAFNAETLALVGLHGHFVPESLTSARVS